jgi:PmbA protein
MSHQCASREGESLRVVFEKNSLTTIERSHTSSKHLRCIQNGKLANVAGEKDCSLDDLLSRAQDLIPFGEPVDFEFPPSQSYDQRMPPNLDYVDALKQEDLTELGQYYLREGLKRFPSISIDLTLEKTSSNLEIENSLGLSGSYAACGFSVSLQIFECKENQIFEWNRSLESPPQSKADLDQFFVESFDEIEFALQTSELSPGTYPFIFTPQSLVSGVLAPLFEGLSAGQLESSTSPLTEKLDNKILSEKITLHENANFIPFDMDGLPTYAKTYVDSGVLKAFPIPLAYAKKLGRKPTASSFAGGGFSDLSMNPGQGSLKAWISAMDEGVLLMASYNLTQGNIINGDLSGIISMGFHIKNGKVAGRISNRTLAMNFYETFGANLCELTQERSRFGHAAFMEMPHALCSGITVA